MITWDDSDSEKCSSSDDEQTNIYMMEDIGKKVKAKTYFESYTCFECDTSSNASSDNEEEIPYDVLLQNCHMISLQYKEKYKISMFENVS